jgi:predicted TIM-barrel fold metal-dependent hydrolase
MNDDAILPPSGLIDVQVYISRWPFRRLPNDEPARLARSLRDIGVTEAWVGNFDALLHRDVAAVNDATFQECQRLAEFGWKAVGCINPKLPDWQEDLRRCVESFRMHAIRIHPNYHGYKLADPEFAELLKLASAKGLLVQIALSMEDARTQHPLVQVPRTEMAPLRELLSAHPQAKVMLLNHFHGGRPETAAEGYRAGQVWFDIATLEGVEGVKRLVDAIDADAVVYGSLAPLFYEQSPYLKLVESGLPPSLIARVCFDNAAKARGAA